MVPEIILVTVFLVSLLIIKTKRNHFAFAQAAQIGMAAMLMVTGISHFTFTRGMVMMLPDAVPYKTILIYVTGVLELLAAIGLLMSRCRRITAWLLIIFFIVLLPANIYAALRHVDIQQGTLNGKGPDYLWIRIPLQIVFIAWVYFFCLKRNRPRANKTAGERPTLLPNHRYEQ